MNIKEFKAEFQGYLTRAVQEKLSTYSEYTSDPTILGMIQYAENVIGGGKCVRPYMAYLMYTGLGGTDTDRVMDLLVSVEVFHSFALIHDDVIDKGTTRHEHQTIHTHITEELEHDDRWSKDFVHDGNSQAILIGDILFSWALERFQDFYDLPNHREAWKVFTKMIDEVAVGQMIDVDIMTRHSVDTQLIETKMRLKTAGYTFVRPMQIGAALAGRGADMAEFCENFGIALGLAFQTQDDVLDLLSDPEIIKKTVLSDIRDHQHTFLTQYVFENGSPEDIQELQSIWGTEVLDTDQDRIIDIFVRTGALDYTQEMIQTYLARARQLCLSDTELSEDGRQDLENLITYIENRSH